MILGASELIVLNDDPIKNAKRLHEISPTVEMMLDGNGWDDVNESWQKKAERLAGLGIPFTIHPPAWDHNVAAGLRGLRKAAQELNKAALEVCTIVGAKEMVFHTGYCDRGSRFSRESAQKYSMEALYELIELAKPHNITLAVENVSSKACALYTQEEYCHILDGVDETAQYLIDVGHANVNEWNVPEVISAVGPRLAALHIHDNNGRSDQHTPIYGGSLPWNEIFSEMDKLKKDCHFILEYAPGTDLAELKKGCAILEERFGKK